MKAHKANLNPQKVPTAARDWHAQRDDHEPRCGADQWRTRDRAVITYMHEMHDRHLGHCIRFAATKPQHASRLASLMEERARRELGITSPRGQGLAGAHTLVKPVDVRLITLV